MLQIKQRREEVLVSINEILQYGHHSMIMSERYRVIAIDLLTMIGMLYVEDENTRDKRRYIANLDKVHLSYFLYDVLQFSYRLKNNLLLFVTIDLNKPIYVTYLSIPARNPLMRPWNSMSDIKDLQQLKETLKEVFHQLDLKNTIYQLD